MTKQRESEGKFVVAMICWLVATGAAILAGIASRDLLVCVGIIITLGASFLGTVAIMAAREAEIRGADAELTGSSK